MDAERWQSLRLLARHAVRFGAVGLAAAGVDYGVLMGLVQLGAMPALARLPSTAVALVFTWVFNRRLTFATRAPPSWREFARYAAAALAGIAINLGVYWGALALALPLWLAFVAGTGVAAIYTFLNYRKLLHDR